MLDKINSIFHKVRDNKLSKVEAVKKLEAMITFNNETEDNLLIALAVIELEK